MFPELPEKLTHTSQISDRLHSDLIEATVRMECIVKQQFLLTLDEWFSRFPPVDTIRLDTREDDDTKELLVHVGQVLLTGGDEEEEGRLSGIIDTLIFEFTPLGMNHLLLTFRTTMQGMLGKPGWLEHAAREWLNDPEWFVEVQREKLGEAVTAGKPGAPRPRL